MVRRFWVIAALTATVPQSAWAEVKLHALFADGAVLQRNQPIKVWGTASEGEQVTVELAGKRATAKTQDGRWLVIVPALPAGGPYTLNVAGENKLAVKDVWVGEVWICSGQSNMQWPLSRSSGAAEAIAQSANNKLRLFTVPRQGTGEPQRDVVGKWSPCGPQTVGEFSAVAYYFGRDLQKALGVAVGLINTSYGGTPAEAWTSRQALRREPTLKGMVDAFDQQVASYDPVKAKERYQQQFKAWQDNAAQAKKAGKQAPRRPFPPVEPTRNAHAPTTLYNAMIAPLIPYGIKGAIWYQGESNAGRAKEYHLLFPTMIRCWREAWGQGDFPFLFVQLAPFANGGGDWPELRESQRRTVHRVPKTGMAVITDAGDRTDIHPQNKEPVGARLALAGRAIAYGEKIEYSGPDFAKLDARDGRAVLTFRHVGGGLEARGPLDGFEIAGADRKFVPAKAEIEGDNVVVSSPEVSQPVVVRYGWSNYPTPSLWNRAGLPASPFRSDN
jgi:sialate O-acetylesterase